MKKCILYTSNGKRLSAVQCWRFPWNTQRCKSAKVSFLNHSALSRGWRSNSSPWRLTRRKPCCMTQKNKSAIKPMVPSLELRSPEALLSGCWAAVLCWVNQPPSAENSSWHPSTHDSVAPAVKVQLTGLLCVDLRVCTLTKHRAHALFFFQES